MAYIELKEEQILVCGNIANKELRQQIEQIATSYGYTIEETCELIHNTLQAIQDMSECLVEQFKELLDILDTIDKDICESCIDRRTRHTESETEQPIGKYIIKWSEKYRPP